MNSICKGVYIAQLPLEAQVEIAERLVESLVLCEDFDRALDSKLNELEDTIQIGGMPCRKSG